MQIDQIKHNVSLKALNTFGIEASAKYFAGFSDVDQLEAAVEYSYEHAADRPLILGGGSNILLTGNIDGLVLKNEIKGINVIREDERHVYVQAGAGESWHQLVLFCLERNLAGVENLSLIPGNVGASPMQNIGAYGVEIKDMFEELEAYHLPSQRLIQFTLNDCEFGYRESVFKRRYKDQFVILNVTYRLNKHATLNTSYGAIEQELEKNGSNRAGYS